MVNSKRVVRDDKFIIVKVVDCLTRDTIFKGRALMSNKEEVNRMFSDMEAKGVFLR